MAQTEGYGAISCEDCQVAVSHNKVIGRGIFDLENNVFCSSCEKNPTKHFSPKKFRCNRCNDIVTIDHLRSGQAMAVEEKVYCSTCKRKVPASEKAGAAAPAPAPDPAPQPPAEKPPAASRAGAPASRQDRRPTPRAPLPPDRKKQQRITGEVRCDLCNKPFRLSDLRVGSAQIKDGKVLCPRCLTRLSRRSKKYDAKFILSLVFIVIVFPVVSAALIVVGFLLVNAPKDGGGESKEEARGPSVPAPGTREDLHPPERGGASDEGTTPAAQTPPPPTGFKLSKEDMAEILRNLGAGDDAEGVAPPAGEETTPPPGRKDGTGAPKESAALSALLDHADPAVRLEAVVRAGIEGSAELVPKLADRLRDADPFVRALAATALGKMKAREASPALLVLIRDREKMVRRAAAWALVKALDLRIKHASDFSDDEIDNFIRYLQWLKKKKAEEAKDRKG
jgi:hypothetical protein